ncbi:helix-turn-helix domain-containing protein [Xanthobacter wiegelii]|uniref:helix-turn-helix domain-containing protein n=1 Tax=Xanthobacter wiegelii TaxID=3119913 RepID=UPI003729F507
MKLADYLKQKAETYASFGAKVGVSAFAIGKYARGERTPRPAVLRRIHTETGGIVTANDFGDFAPPTPANDTGPSASEDAA